MKYLMLIKHSESHRSQPIPAGLEEAMGKFVEDGFKSGVSRTPRGSRAPPTGCEFARAAAS